MTDRELWKAKEAFAAWHRCRTKKARAPEHLQKMTILLSRRYPLARLARELEISTSRIKNWQRGLSTKPVSFVEFRQPSAQKTSSSQLEGNIAIEFFRPSGGMMKISGRLSCEQLLAVTNAFVYGLKTVLEESA